MKGRFKLKNMEFTYVTKLNSLYKGKHFLKDRNISILEFQMRLFDLVKHQDTPFMERINFIKIICSNLEEFIITRLANDESESTQNELDMIETIYHNLGVSLDIFNKLYKINEDCNDINYYKILDDKTFCFVYAGESGSELPLEMNDTVDIKSGKIRRNVLYSGDVIPDVDYVEHFIHVPRNIINLKYYVSIYEKMFKDNTDIYYPKDTKPYINLDFYTELQYRDILIRNPYESYDHVLDFINQMCHHPNIKGIFITLYRTSSDSEIIKSLICAKKLGKDVSVYVEPTARDSEVSNIQNIQTLLKHGITVECNYYNYKVHGKIFCAVDISGRVYSHIGTGNYNENTARVYTDFHLLTANPDVTNDALSIVMSLFLKDSYTKRHPFDDYQRLIFSSPLDFRFNINNLIELEKKKGTNGRIWIKCNSICDCAIIDKLYQAANAGVDVKIICRTGCSLNFHPNIQIKSKVGKYLEHDRFYIFGDNVYISSADLLLRNINKRFELVCQIIQPDNINKVIDTFVTLWNDPYIHYLDNDGFWKIK